MNNVKLVTYDLKSGNYDKLLDRIRSFSNYARITESTWLIDTKMKSSELRDDLKKMIEEEDRLFVTEIAGSSAWHNCRVSTQSVKNHLHSIF